MGLSDKISSRPVAVGDIAACASTNSVFERSLTEGADGAPRYRGSPESLAVLAFFADLFLILAVVVLSSMLVDWLARSSRPDILGNLLIGLTVAVLFVGIFGLRGGYRLDALRNARHQLRMVGTAIFFAFFFLGWIGFLSKTTASFSRLDLTTFFFASFAALAALHWGIARWLNGKLAAGDLSLRRAVVIADAHQRSGEDFWHLMRRNGIEVVDLVELSSSQFRRDDFSATCRHAVERARAAVSRGPVDGIFLFLNWVDRRAIDEMRFALSGLPVPIHLFADTETQRVLRCPHFAFGGLNGYELQRAPLGWVDRALKRIFDVAVSASALVMLAPLMAMIALAIRLGDGGVAIFRQQRKGFGGRPFTIYKFRTMTCVEDGAVVEQAVRNDPRVTRLGAILRRTSADELPQFWNVLKGEMSVCGPRPHAIAHDNLYDRIIARYAFRHHVKPGITGWAQVNGYRGETRDLARMEARVEHDIWYVNNWTIWLDLRILFRTFLSGWIGRNVY